MKQFTAKEILKRFNNGDCDWYGTQLAPFPGKYPTRVLLYVQYYDPYRGEPKAAFDYLGKPSPSAIKAFANAADTDGAYQVTAVEFDRKNMISSFVYVGRYSKRRFEANEWRLPVTYYNRTLWHVYYPWEGDLRMLYMHMQPWWPKRVGGVPCYSPYQTLSIFDHIGPHKQWLKARGLLREQRTKTATA